MLVWGWPVRLYLQKISASCSEISLWLNWSNRAELHSMLFCLMTFLNSVFVLVFQLIFPSPQFSNLVLFFILLSYVEGLPQILFRMRLGLNKHTTNKRVLVNSQRQTLMCLSAFLSLCLFHPPSETLVNLLLSFQINLYTSDCHGRF